MARQIRLQRSTAVIGTAQTGKTSWSVENFLQNPEFSIFIDYNRAYLRMAQKNKWPMEIYTRGPWFEASRRIWAALGQYKKVVYLPDQASDIEALVGYVMGFKDEEIQNFEEICIYFDEVDKYCPKGSRVEEVFTKYQGPNIVGIPITQKVAQMDNLNIIGNCTGGVVLFYTTGMDRTKMVNNYGIEISDEEYAYTKEQTDIKAGDPKRKAYNAVLVPWSGERMRL